VYGIISTAATQAAAVHVLHCLSSSYRPMNWKSDTSAPVDTNIIK
jgi:hypothetical protein